MSLTKAFNDFYYHMSMHELQLLNENEYYNGLSYNSLLYLNVISQMEECTVSRLAAALHVTKPAVTAKINELEKQGIITKTQSRKDKRIYFLSIHEGVRDTFSIYDRVFDQIEDMLKQKYSAEQLTLFDDIFHTVMSYEWRNLHNE